jgi:hypothetical protein
MDKLHSFNFISFSSVDAYSGAIARKNAGARKKQRTCAAVAVFALLFGLSGCSQSSGSTSDKAVNEIQKEKSEEKNLTVAPQKITVKAGVSQLFTALDDDNQPAEGVVWSIHGASAGDSAIQSTGWLTIADDASGVITVTATAGSASGYADVAISDEPPEYDDPTSPPPPLIGVCL